MLIQGQTGPLPSAKVAAGSVPTVQAGTYGELLESRLNADYYTLVKNGLTYSVSASAISPAAFTGGAAGTPAIGIFNPSSSGKDLVILDATVGIRTTGTAAAAIDFNHFAVLQGSVAVTGTATAPRNMYTLQASGSVATAMVNVVNTAALASFAIRPSISVGLTAATAVTNVGAYRDEVKGAIIIPPGGYYAFGAAAAPTAGSFDITVTWAEVPA